MFLIGLRAWRTCTAGTLYGSIRRRFRTSVCGCGAEPTLAGSVQKNPQGIVPVGIRIIACSGKSCGHGGHAPQAPFAVRPGEGSGNVFGVVGLNQP
ncbi:MULTISPECIES: hypothetical protein [unclassified Sphingobacterium]|uniref:hypothetical protein n=1 Tax=unclassified Sphingobacterium TaxID=2609468 RepID=UPI0020C3B083|nr:MULTISPECIES: hypothetical protein [unclassified Sphingobacterium]